RDHAMDVREKVVAALTQGLEPAFIRLDDDDGISGFVVSRQFEGLSGMDRQLRIDEALASGHPALTKEEQRHVLMIAGLTQVEYEVVGMRIRVEDVKETRDGVEILIDGPSYDTQHVRA